MILLAKKWRLRILFFAGVSLLIALLIFKLQVISMLSPLVFEVGEIENSQGLQACAPSLTRMSESQTIVERLSNFCENYWFKIGYRGFFMHHYASYASPPLQTYSVLPQSLIHQYGIAGRLQSLLFIAFGQTLSPGEFASLSLLSIIPLTAVVAVILARYKRNLLAACVFIYLISLYIAGLDMFQFILSPGFTPLRHLPVCLFLALLVDVPSIRHKQASIPALGKPAARNIRLFLLSTLLAALNSVSSNLMILVGLIISLLLLFIVQPALRNFILQSRDPRPALSPLLAIAAAVAVVTSLQLALLLSQDPAALVSSVGQGNPSRKPWIIFVILFSVSFLYLGRSSWDVKGKRSEAFITQLCSPLLIIPSLLVLYAFNFWGSPNHLATGWLLITWLADTSLKTIATE